ncbi:hypothetical protein IQ238_05635 [Pleurocapsales cyanobacterium LEGE 06147]|nr:hypothetical protein [Pleurocapsales cyanobacterium LEGE 06147]
MRRRTRRRIARPSLNYDSFLDTLTNTLGVLMFICLFTSLIASQSNSNAVVRTPLVSDTKKTPRFFEIRDNNVTYIDDEKIGKEIEQLTVNLPACNRPNLPTNSNPSLYQNYAEQFSYYRDCLRSRASRLVNFQSRTEYYNVSMVNASTFSLLYEPIDGKVGESKEELTIENSEFNQILAKLDPTKDYLAFIVRPNSFATFREAREQAWTKGFNVGWEPHKIETPIIFGSGGRAIGVQ